MSIDRGVCPLNGKARFTYDEAVAKAHKAKMRGEAMTVYRCRACAGWSHCTHAGDGHGGGVRRPKRRIPKASERRARRGTR